MTRIIHEGQYTCLIVCRSLLLRLRNNISDTICRENQNTHLIFNNFLENCASVEKYCRPELATDKNMAHAHCMLDTLRLQIHSQMV
jgi:hypothetical protein